VEDSNYNRYLVMAAGTSQQSLEMTTDQPLAPVWNTLEAPTLTSLTVVSNAPYSQIDATNWACVKTATDDWIYLQATLSAHNDNTNAGNAIQWQGGEAVPGNPFQRRVTKTDSVETTVTAALGTNNFTRKVWVIWATVSILTGGGNPSPLSFTNSNFVLPLPDDQLGIQYYYLDSYGVHPPGITNFAAGKICAVATITPADIHSIITNDWNFVQNRICHDFIDGAGDPAYSDSNWQPDGPSSFNINKTSVPDHSDKLYSIDYPDIAQFTATDSHETYNNFCDWITWKSQICCDTNNFWNFQGRWKVNQTPQITVGTVGTGTIALPTNSFYPPP